MWASWLLKSLTTQLFVQQIVQANREENIKAAHYWPSVWGIHQWLVDSLHKEPVMFKSCPHHDIIMIPFLPTALQNSCNPRSLRNCQCQLFLNMHEKRDVFCFTRTKFLPSMETFMAATHWSRDRVAAILCTWHFQINFLDWNLTEACFKG